MGDETFEEVKHQSSRYSNATFGHDGLGNSPTAPQRLVSYEDLIDKFKLAMQELLAKEDELK